jgi:endonuclease/exonuclease/phosphatase family metal-dependent hydrolase
MAGGFLRRFTKKFFVFCNVIIAVFFLLGCYASWFDPQYFWFLGLFTLASLYLLIALILFIIFWLFAKKKLIFISLVAIALAWKPLRQLIKFAQPQNFTLAKQPATMRVMSWNVEHFDILEHKTKPQVKTQMLDLISMYQPDIACFQEMVGSDFDSTAINYVPYFAERLHFPYNFYCYNKKDDFDNKHRFGIIIFSKYPIIDRHAIRYDPLTYNSTFEYIDILKENDTIRIFNFHLQSLRFSNNDLAYINDGAAKGDVNLNESKNIIAKFKKGFLLRKSQSDHIKTIMNESPYPMVACGDFNDVPNSYAYNTIGAGLKNAFAEKGSGIGRTFSGISPTLRIDNIFVDKRFEVEQYIRIKKKMSDHFPIIADLKFEVRGN